MNTFDQRITQVINDRDHGSRWLMHEAISIIHDLASQHGIPAKEHMQQIHHAARQLASSRPAMAALAVAMGRILSAQGGPAGIAQAANQLLEEYDSAIGAITANARPLLTGTLMTHSLSGTVLEVLIACYEQLKHIFVLEARPRYEGRIVARTLAEHHIPVTLLTDAQADIFLPQCHALVTGADSVLANGDVLNKAGTALLAWAAHGHGVPFYVLCETLKISPHSWLNDLAQLEEKEPGEVLDQPVPGVTVRNFYFDHTPSRLVTKLVTEQGVLGMQEIKDLAATALRYTQILNVTGSNA